VQHLSYKGIHISLLGEAKSAPLVAIFDYVNPT